MTPYKRLSLVSKREYTCCAKLFCACMARRNWHHILIYTTGLRMSFSHSVEPSLILSERPVYAA